jgi:hypothetical protein
MASIPDIFESMAYGPAPEAAAPAHEWLDQHGRRFGLFIGGRWTAAGSETFETLNPATGKPLARLTQASPAEVDRAVRAARAAQAEWWELGGHARARYLYALARQIQKHSRLFAVLESLDNGKPIRESRDIDVPLVARHFYHHAGWAQLMAGELPGRAPVGVIGQIIPWNFPLLMLAWKIAPALAMGNTVVLKPAEFTSLTALRFAELCAEVGLPPGQLARHELGPAGVVVEVAGHQRQVDVARLADRLAVVERLQHGEQPAVLLHLPGEGVQVPRPRVSADGPPVRLRRAGRAHRAVHVPRAGLGQPGERLAGGRIEGLERLAAGLRPSPADEQPEAAAVLLQPRLGRRYRLGRRAVCHGAEDVGNGGHRGLTRWDAGAPRSTAPSRSAPTAARCR